MRIKKAEYVDGYKINLLFNDGITKMVDFKELLSGTRILLTPLLNLDYFKSFYLDEITICWPNGLDFSPDALYKTGKETQIKESKLKPIRTLRRSRKITKTQK
jgi:hypothetical protein